MSWVSKSDTHNKRTATIYKNHRIPPHETNCLHRRDKGAGNTDGHRSPLSSGNPSSPQHGHSGRVPGTLWRAAVFFGQRSNNMRDVDEKSRRKKPGSDFSFATCLANSAAILPLHPRLPSHFRNIPHPLDAQWTHSFYTSHKPLPDTLFISLNCWGRRSRGLVKIRRVRFLPTFSNDLGDNFGPEAKHTNVTRGGFIRAVVCCLSARDFAHNLRPARFGGRLSLPKPGKPALRL